MKMIIKYRKVHKCTTLVFKSMILVRRKLSATTLAKVAAINENHQSTRYSNKKILFTL